MKAFYPDPTADDFCELLADHADMLWEVSGRYNTRHTLIFNAWFQQAVALGLFHDPSTPVALKPADEPEA